MKRATLIVGADYAVALSRRPAWLILPVWGERLDGPEPAIPVPVGCTAWRLTVRSTWRVTDGPPPRDLAPLPRTGARVDVREPWRVAAVLGRSALVEYSDGARVWHTARLKELRAVQDRFQPASTMPAQLNRRTLIVVAQRPSRAADLTAAMLTGCGLPSGHTPGRFLAPRGAAEGLTRPTPEVDAPEALARWWARWWPKAAAWSPSSWCWVAQVKEATATAHADRHP